MQSVSSHSPTGATVCLPRPFTPPSTVMTLRRGHFSTVEYLERPGLGHTRRCHGVIVKEQECISTFYWFTLFDGRFR